MSARDGSIDDLLAKRDSALASLDMAYFRIAMPGTTDEIRLIAAHKARYECRAIADELRHASGDWLRTNCYQRIGGLPLLPEGELPT